MDKSGSREHDARLLSPSSCSPSLSASSSSAKSPSCPSSSAPSSASPPSLSSSYLSPPSPCSRSDSSSRKIYFVFLCLGIKVTSAASVLPILPFFITQTLHGSAAELGFSTSIFAFSQMVSSLCFGRLSDSVGRRSMLLTSFFWNALGLFLTSLSTSIPSLYLSRAISGLSGGGIALASAMICDATADNNRTQADRISNQKQRVFFNIVMGAVLGLGFVVGPALGGVAHFLTSNNRRLCLLIAASGSIFALLLGLFTIPETLPPGRRRPFVFILGKKGRVLQTTGTGALNGRGNSTSSAHAQEEAHTRKAILNEKECVGALNVSSEPDEREIQQGGDRTSSGTRTRNNEGDDEASSFSSSPSLPALLDQQAGRDYYDSQKEEEEEEIEATTETTALLSHNEQEDLVIAGVLVEKKEKAEEGCDKRADAAEAQGKRGGRGGRESRIRKQEEEQEDKRYVTSGLENSPPVSPSSSLSADSHSSSCYLRLSQKSPSSSSPVTTSFSRRGNGGVSESGICTFGLSMVCLSRLCLSLGATVMGSTYFLLLQDSYSFERPDRQISKILTVTGLCVVQFQGCVCRRVVALIGTHGTMVVGCLLQSLGTYVAWYSAVRFSLWTHVSLYCLTYSLAYALIEPNIPTVSALYADKQHQGFAHGCVNSSRFLATIIGPAIYGRIYRPYSPYPFWIAASAASLPSVFMLLARYYGDTTIGMENRDERTEPDSNV